MCGIAGVVFDGTGETGTLLMTMLRGLQHRGLDSAGAAFFNTEVRGDDEYVIGSSRRTPLVSSAKYPQRLLRRAATSGTSA